MEAKLIKVLEHYHLYDGDKAIATTIVGNPMLLPNLSLKNCEAIANGYDLDELADEYCNKIPFTLYEQEIFKDGFQKALEILGDKKFSEDDVKLAIEYGIQSVLQAVPGVTSTQSVLDNYTQSIQQTEWDVEVEMENKPYKYLVTIGEVTTSKLEPKLDADGCIILKRK